MAGQTIDNDGTYDPVGLLGQAVLDVTRDAGTAPGNTPDVTLNFVSVLSAFTVNATNGAHATVNVTVGAGSAYQFNANGGTIRLGTLVGALSATDAEISNGGTFDTGGNLVSLLNGTHIGFGSGGGELLVGSPSLLNLSGVSIDGFSKPGDEIDDKAIAFTEVGSYGIADSGRGGETITFYAGPGGTGGPLGSITLGDHPFVTGTYGTTGGPLALHAGPGGLLAIDACFLAGTRIATPDGPRAVEAIAPGDRVVTAGGEVASVIWTGARRVDRARAADRRRPAPIRMLPDALAPGVPQRALWLTPDHAIFVDGALVPVRLLVNGTTIRPVALASYTYFHIELETHDLLLAEGVAAESYLDTGNRHAFDDAGAMMALVDPGPNPRAAAIYASLGCHDLVLDAATLAPIRRRLAQRAALLAPPVPAAA